ncbi:hypothetical protein [Amycolatopsis sp. cmx-11-51]|uniref:hypothetical protein n=1 Tax=Amycolatopsis sp. cmx-11-51 TaxID=2785797 RepID=UPI0039E44893
MCMVQPLGGLRDLASRAAVELSGYTAVVIVSQDGRRFTFVQYEGSEKGIFVTESSAIGEDSDLRTKIAKFK